MNTVVTNKKLKVTFDITDNKSLTYSLNDPSQDVDFEAVQTFASAAIEAEAFEVDELPVTGLKTAYVETTTKEYLEA